MAEDKQLVALYNFDPSKIDWPFKRQKPLPLQTGQTIKVMYDDGSDWLLGMLVSDPTQKGYFPKNYTVTLHEYYELMKEYAEGSEDEASTESDKFEAKEAKEKLPHPSQPVANFQEYLQKTEEEGDEDEDEFDDDDEAFGDVKEGVRKHPPLSSQPPIPTTLSDAKTKLLKEMPKFGDTSQSADYDNSTGITQNVGDMALADAATDLMTKKIMEDREAGKRLLEDGGKISDTRASTPATYTAIRPPRDFVRRHMEVENQQQQLRKVTALEKEIQRQGLQDYHPTVQKPLPYKTDLRIRATTCRIAAGIEPPHMRIALEKARACGARWTQMFRPGLNDIVNESVKMGADASILSNLYMYDYEAREQFMRQHIRDVKGVMWFELQRRKQHLFYMRMDFVDLMMFHPDAWGFPDALQPVLGAPGEAFDALHGWYAQKALDNDQEMEEAIFSYKLRQRKLPSHTFQALALGKIPEWVQSASEIHAETQALGDLEEVLEDDDDAESDAGAAANVTVPPEEAGNAENPEERSKKKKIENRAKGKQLTTQQMLEAGLGDEEDVYLKVNDTKFVKQRTIGPDVLDVITRSYKLKGTNAMRLFLRSRGSPDKTNGSIPVSPKQIKDLAVQLGILGNYHFYWYAFFALRYPLPPHWDVIIKNDVRWYINLETEHVQPIHPMIDQFREHLGDHMANDFLWEYRGFVRIKCSECGIPDSIVWCQQCTDYFCITCFLKTHKSNRGRKHWCSPIPGCRYLKAAEVQIMKDYVPLLNVGFSNRRRFLARDNQSDKTGYDGGDKWMYFPKATFEQALAITPEKHWFLQRLNPPRLGSNQDGYYYNFKEEIVSDDPGHIIQKAKEQKALLSLQRFVRGALVRARINRETAACIVIQKYKRMWDCRKIYGSHGSNATILRGWYRKFKARQQKELMHKRAAQIQALFRGKIVRISINDQNLAAAKIQACFRGSICRHSVKQYQKAADLIQRYYKAHLYGKKPVREMNDAASRIQAMVRGNITRKRNTQLKQAMSLLQARVRGVLVRENEERRQVNAVKIQSHWRRWQEQLNMKMRLYNRLEEIYAKRKEVMNDKLKHLAATILQRNVRRHRSYEHFILLKREKAEADKRISTVLVSALLGSANMKHFVHPWFRHLPPEIQEVIEQIKASLQRTIGLTRITGKMANEEIGKRSKRTTADDLVMDEEENDLATHMMITIVHHLLSHVSNDVFSQTIKWCCYQISHLATSFLHNGAWLFDEIELGQQPDMPVQPRPGEPLESLYSDYIHIKHHHDRVMHVTPENYYLLFLDNMPSHLRHVFLTAEVLVTTRQALDLSSLSTEDHFAFQGVDATVGAQLMDTLSKEMGVRFPSDWPKAHGTVHALASQMGKYITSLPGASAGPSDGRVTDPDINPLLSRNALTVMGINHKGGSLSFFNRPAVLRILQQLGYLMRDQESIIEYIRNKKNIEAEQKKSGENNNVRQSRFISVIDKLFDIAYKAKHDHCPFVLAVVLFHMVSRGLMLRTFYHRAAVSLQSKYRYYKTTTLRKVQLGPAIILQRYFRGVKTSLQMYNQMNAVEMIQHNIRAKQRRVKNEGFYKGVFVAQRYWRGAIARRWLRTLHASATKIQSHVRRLLVVVIFNKEGRRLAAKLKQESLTLMGKTANMTDTEFLARKASLVAKTKVQLHKHRDRCIDYRRMMSIHGQSRHARQKKKENRDQMKGSIQPVRETWAEPISFATSSANRKQKEQSIIDGSLAPSAVSADDAKTPAAAGFQKSAIMGMTENAKRALEKTMPLNISGKKLHPLMKRGYQIMATKRLVKRPKAVNLVEEEMIDANMLSSWETKQFRTSIPWIPKCVGLRLVMPHQQHNLRAMYFLATSFLGGLLSRTDDKRPVGWCSRMKLPKPTDLPKDVQEHLANASKIICTKLNQDVTTLNTNQLSPWRKALNSFMVIWKALFSYAGSRMAKPVKAMPVLLMSCNESMANAVNFLLYQVWNETGVQFTTKENRYRGIKSRPKWDVLETIEYNVVGKKYGFGLNNPANDPVVAGAAMSTNSVKAANLQDFLEEVTVLRFASELIEASTKDAEEFMDNHLKKKEKAKKKRQAKKTQDSSLTPEEQKKMALESFTQSTWNEDAEVRSLCKHVGLLIQSLEGKDAHLQAMTVVSMLCLSAWRGVQPLLESAALRSIDEIDSRHIQNQTIPAPRPDHPDDGLNTQGFALLAKSYIPGDPKKSEQILNAAPTAILALVCRLQSVFKGHMMRSRYFTRTKTISYYCKDINWPTMPGDDDDEIDELEQMTRKATRKTEDAKNLDEKIATYKPKVSQYLGGQGLQAEQKQKELKRPGGDKSAKAASLPRADGKASGTKTVEKLEELPQVRITADHRACADMFAVYLYNMYRRKEMAKIWCGLSFAYDTVIKNFASLLDKNTSLKPMVESVSAQLKRGKAVGFSKAYVPKAEVTAQGGHGEVAAPGRIRPVESELFHKPPPKAHASPKVGQQQRKKQPWEDDGDDVPRMQQVRQQGGSSSSSAAVQQLPTGMKSADSTMQEPGQEPAPSRPIDPNAITLSGDYLTQYLEETNGDDSQFKDIEPSVIPYSSGTSPRRERPDEFLFKQHAAEQSKSKTRTDLSSTMGNLDMNSMMQKQAQSLGLDADQLDTARSGGSSASNKPYKAVPTPNVTVDWCKQKLKPMWLPIKAHRFTACRSKVLQLLPQKQLASYVEHEKSCHYAACIKLLETCIPGNLNVFQPNLIVANRPLLVETIFQLLVGYIGLCLKNNDTGAASRLCMQTLEAMQTALKDLHPAHRAVLEAYLYDTALSVAYYSPSDVQLAGKAESFFQQASQRYLKLKHVYRFSKCCIRYASVLFSQSHHHEAEYFLQQALNKLTNSPVSSLLVVCYHNLCISTATQERIPDAGSHMRTYISLLRQMSKLSNQWIQKADNTQWVVLKMQELWPAYHAEKVIATKN